MFMAACSLHLQHHWFSNSAVCYKLRKQGQIAVNIMHMQSQSGGNNCGCFAIACAAVLCHGQYPSALVWVQSKMQQYLANCITNRKLTPFPARKAAKSKHSTDVKKIFTILHMPNAIQPKGYAKMHAMWRMVSPKRCNITIICILQERCIMETFRLHELHV